MYAGIVDPLGPLFNPAYSVSRIIAHEGYDSRTRRNDIALMRLSKALDTTGAHGHINIHTGAKMKIKSQFTEQKSELPGLFSRHL